MNFGSPDYKKQVSGINKRIDLRNLLGGINRFITKKKSFSDDYGEELVNPPGIFLIISEDFLLKSGILFKCY